MFGRIRFASSQSCSASVFPRRIAPAGRRGRLVFVWGTRWRAGGFIRPDALIDAPGAALGDSGRTPDFGRLLPQRNLAKQGDWSADAARIGAPRPQIGRPLPVGKHRLSHGCRCMGEPRQRCCSFGPVAAARTEHWQMWSLGERSTTVPYRGGPRAVIDNGPERRKFLLFRTLNGAKNIAVYSRGISPGESGRDRSGSEKRKAADERSVGR